MHGSGQLKLLEVRKAVVQLSLARRRIACAEDAERIAAPVRSIEALAGRVYAWRKLWPVVVALWGLRPRGRARSRFGILRTILRFFPLALRLWQLRRPTPAED